MSWKNKLNILNIIKKPYLRLSNEVNLQDLLKAVAIVTMIIDHLGFYFFPEALWMRSLGRNSHIIWLFFVGYNYKKEATFQSILLYLALSIVIFSYCLETPIFPLNILFTILIYKIILKYYIEYIYKNSRLYYYLIIVSVALSPIGNILEYGTLGFFITIFGYNLRHNLGDLSKQALWLVFIDFISQGAIFQSNYNNIILRFIVISFSIFIIYKFKPISLNISGVMKYIINISSRYSLYLYSFNLLLFIFIKRVIL